VRPGVQLERQAIDEGRQIDARRNEQLVVHQITDLKDAHLPVT
jgi:hypothetical protein